MKLCDITQAYSPESGGIKTYLEEKRRYLVQNRRHYHILIIPGKYDNVSRGENWSSYSVAAPVVPGYESYRFIVRLHKILSILETERPDIIEVGSPDLLPYLAFLYRMLHRGTVLIGFYHTHFPEAYVGSFLRKKMTGPIVWHVKAMAERYARFLHARYDATIVASESVRTEAERMALYPLHMIHMGVDLKLFHPARRNAAVRSFLGLRDDAVCFIYAGRLDREKRIDILLEAFQIIADKFQGRLVIIGAGPLKGLVENSARNNGKIIFRPYQNRENLAVLLASADVYVTAGPYETFGLSVVEAQASGLPVIGVRSGALVDRVPASVGVLAPVDSPSAMAAYMLAYAGGGFRFQGQNARKLVEQNFSWNKTFEQLLNIYEAYYHLKKTNRKSS